MPAKAPQRGYSSAGRALAWHARGQRFDPAYLHQSYRSVQVLTLSSRGLGHHPFTVSTGVRIPVGSPSCLHLVACKAQRKKHLPGVVVQLVRIPACHAGGRGFEPRPLRQNGKAVVFTTAFFLVLGLHSYPRHQLFTPEGLALYLGCPH